MFFVCFTGSIYAETGAFHLHCSKHHLWMLYKIAVHCDTILVRVKVYPLWLYLHNSVTLF